MIVRLILMSCLLMGRLCASLGIQPALLSNGSVNVISGEYCEQATDMVVRCAEPIALQRYYIGGEIVSQGRGKWHLFREELVVEEDGDVVIVDLYEGDGTSLSFKGKCRKHVLDRDYWHSYSEIKMDSFVGIPGDEEGLWGRRYDKFVYEQGKFTLFKGNCEVCTYEKASKRSTSGKAIFLLKRVVRSNGNRVFYTYDDDNRLIKIHSTNAQGDQIFGSIELTHQPHQIFAKGSDGQSVIYDYTWHSAVKNESSPPFLTYTLSKVTLPGGRVRQYYYDMAWNREYLPFALTKADQGGIAYWWRGWNRWGKHSVELGKKDFQLGRVRLQSTREGSSLYSYFYYHDTQGGHTDVIDGNGHCEAHYYTNYGRLDAIATPNGWTRYWWSDEDGKLTIKGRFDTTGKRGSLALWYHTCNGDHFSKPTVREDITGNHTGCSEGFLEFQENRCIIHGLETLRRDWFYLATHRALVEREEDHSTLTEYTYKKNTNLLASKLTYHKTSNAWMLKNREFYRYHEGFLVKSISDNGSAKDPGSDEGVTEKSITKISLNKKCLPEVIERYDLEGLVSRRVLHYDIRNLVIQEDHYDSSENFVYSIYRKHDEAGRIIEESDPLGELSLYDYDEWDHMTSLSKGGITTTYIYDKEGRCVETWLADDKDQVLIEKSIYDPLGNKIVAIDNLGRKTHFSYDAAGNITQVIAPPIRMEQASWKSSLQKMKYDELGHLIAETRADGQTVQYKRTSRGDPYHIIYPDGNEEHLEYNLEGFLIKHIFPTGIYILYERDSLGRECSTTIYSSEGEPLSHTVTTYEGSYKTSHVDGEGHATDWHYNKRGQLIEECQGKGRTTFRYDPLGRMTARTEWYGEGLVDGITTIWEYDLLHRPISEKKLDGHGEILAHSETAYGPRGEPIRKTIYHNGQRSTVQKSYDLLGRQIEEVDPLGHKKVTKWCLVDFEGHPTLMQKTWDFNNQVTEITYDDQDHPILEEVRSPTGLLLSKTERWFDLRGNKTLETHFRSSEQAPLSIRWIYNRDGQLAVLQEACGSNEPRATQYFYDRFNRLERMVKPSGSTTYYAYDLLGRLFSSQGEGFSYTYTYDHNGEVVTAGETKRKYNAAGQVTDETFAHGFSIHFAYDGLGRCIEETLHDGSQVRYLYGAYLNQVERINSTGFRTYTHQYLRYNQLGQPTHTKTLFGEEIFVSYDLLGRCVEIQSAPYHEALRQFDPMGNLLERMVRDSKEVEYRYRYSFLNQLESESGAETHTYSYDSLHNRKQVDGKSCIYNLHNQLLSDGTSRYTYDLDGRLIRIETPEETLDLNYDGRDRLISATTGRQIVYFTYDAFNRRLSKEVVDHQAGCHSKRYFLYEGNREIGACDEQGNIVQFRALGYGQGAEVGAAVSIELDGEVYAPIHDHKGSVVALIDSHNQIVESYRYTAFGECEIRNYAHHIQETTNNPYRFSSKRCDEETGLIYFGERYYAPKIGGWITPDPLGFIDGPNLYTFVTGNPLLHLDLWGLSKKRRRAIRAFIATAIAVIATVIAADQADRRIRSAAHGNGQLGSRDNWEKYHPEQSQLIVSGQDPPTHVINGINTSLRDAISNADYLKQHTGIDGTVMVYNGTGGLLTDVFEAFLGLFGVQTPAVRRLHEAWDAALARNETILQVAHSQGCIHVRNALVSYDHFDRERIHVVAISPAAYIHESICGRSMHYCSSRDLVPRLDFMGRERCKAYTKIIPGVGNGMNHSFQHPMYLKYLKEEVEKFHEKQG